MSKARTDGKPARRATHAATKRKPENQEKEASVLSVSGALECISSWEKIRGIRDARGGSAQESEAVLGKLTGDLTDLELVTQLLNRKELAAAESLSQWRNSTIYDSGENDADDLKHDPFAELLEIHEAFRAVKATGDSALVRMWLRSQSYPVKFLIVNLLAKLPTTTA